MYYDAMDKPGFLAKLKYYLEHPEEARKIGLQGHVHATKYHRTVRNRSEGDARRRLVTTGDRWW